MKEELYREEIIEMIGKIEDERFLRNIYILLRDYLEEKQNSQTGGEL